MKTRISLVMILVLACSMFALPTPAQATTPVELIITAELDYFSTGTFEASGLFSDYGGAYQEFFIKADTVHGIKTLTGQNGSITIRFQAVSTYTPYGTAIAEGSFVIVSGTGAYEDLHGVGESYAILNLVTGHISATYTGIGHFD